MKQSNKFLKAVEPKRTNKRLQRATAYVALRFGIE